MLVSLLAGATQYSPATVLYEQYINSNSSEIVIDFAVPFNAATSTGLILLDYVELP
jgi:hypothetical protein